MINSSAKAPPGCLTADEICALRYLDHERAREESYRFLAQAQGIKDRELEAIGELLVASAEIAGGERRAGQAAAHRARSLGSAIGDSSIQAAALRRLALVEKAEQRLRLARSRLAESVPLSVRSVDVVGLSECLRAIGNLEREAGSPERAAKYLRSALSLARQAHSSDRHKALCYLDLGIVSMILEDFRFSVGCLAAACRLTPGTTAPRIHESARWAYSNALALSGLHREATKIYLEVVAWDWNDEARTELSIDLATSLLHISDWEAARQACEAAREALQRAEPGSRERQMHRLAGIESAIRNRRVVSASVADYWLCR